MFADFAILLISAKIISIKNKLSIADTLAFNSYRP